MSARSKSNNAERIEALEDEVNSLKEEKASLTEQLARAEDVAYIDECALASLHKVVFLYPFVIIRLLMLLLGRESSKQPLYIRLLCCPWPR